MYQIHLCVPPSTPRSVSLALILQNYILDLRLVLKNALRIIFCF